MVKKFRYGVCSHCGKKGVYIESKDYVTKYDKRLKHPLYTHYKCKYCSSKFTSS
jgi:DNA-directed RNA polymerase subunit RPC12/RpoP